MILAANFLGNAGSLRPLEPMGLPLGVLRSQLTYLLLVSPVGDQQLIPSQPGFSAVQGLA